MPISLENLVIRAFVLLTAMPIHECAHALTAYWLGDRTAEYEGRLTLNPFNHLDLMGSIMILFAGFGWAKPVPINPLNFRKHNVSMRGGMAITAIAGPLSNLILGLLFFILFKVSLFQFDAIRASRALLMICQINVILAVFNLLPIYPLDGSKVLNYFLPGNAVEWLEEHAMMIQVVFMGVILVTDLLDYPLYFLQQIVLKGFDFLTSMGGLLPAIF